MNALWVTLYALLFFTLLMVSVALHEIGHMVPARLFGVRVPKYFVGFGRTLWSVKRGDTEYGVKMFPLGGFVQLLGMYPPKDPSRKQTRLQRFADEVRAVEWDEISESDRGHLLYERKTWQKVIVMSGGITMNLLISFVLMWGVLGFYGTWQAQPVVDSIQECIITENRECLPSDPLTPAAESGLRAGDRVVEFNGVAIDSYAQLSELIRANMDGEASLVVERSGQRTPLVPVNTVLQELPNNLDPGRTVKAGWFGVVPTHELIKGGPGDALVVMWDMTKQSVVALSQFPVKVWNAVADAVTGKPRDIYGPVSIVGASVFAGEVAASEADVAAKVVMFTMLLASVNLFLALFNLIPLPPLDGGHITSALYEGLRRAAARVFRRPDPGPVDTAKLLPLTYAVAGFLLLAGIALIVVDIVSPIKLL